MTERISLTESYDNKDVITQIFRMADVVEKGTYKDLVVSRDGNNIKFIFTTNDDQVHTYSVPDAGITNVSGSTQGSQVTITFTMTDGTTRSFTYTATGGVTIDTDQTISGMKVFSAASTQFTHDVDVGGDLNAAGMLEVGEDAEIDGDVKCQNATIAGNLKVAGAVQDNIEFTGDNVEIGQMSLEKDGQMTVISNSNGIKIADDTAMSIPNTTTGVRDSKAVNGTRLQNDLDAYASMVRTSNAQTITGIKTLKDDLRMTYNGLYTDTPSSKNSRYLAFVDSNGHDVAYMFVKKNGSSVKLMCALVSPSGSVTEKTIAEI